MADEGQNTDVGIWGKGIWSIFSLNWTALDHLTIRTTPCGVNWVSEQQICFDGSKEEGDWTSRLDLRKKEKKAARQAAQKHLSKLELRSSFVRMPFKTSIVMGSFCETVLPLILLTPFKMEDTYQLFSIGLAKPASKWRSLLTLRYCQTEENDGRLDRKAMYLPRSTWDYGTGDIPILTQK